MVRVLVLRQARGWIDVSKNVSFKKAQNSSSLTYDLEISDDNYIPQLDKDLSVSYGVLQKAFLTRKAIEEIRLALIRLEAVL